MNDFKILVTSAKGITPYTEQEIVNLGLPIIETFHAGVKTRGNWETCIKLNVHLRTAQRVLIQLSQFNTIEPEVFYKEIKKIPWENYLRLDKKFTVRTAVHSPKIKDTRYAGLKCKDAIADRFREVEGERPDSTGESTEGVVHVFWQNANVEIYLDTSGEPLHKRGYRSFGGIAPMQETLAAAIVMASGWDGKSRLINPMCGSGTIVIEAAMIAANIPPGLSRNNWAFLHYKRVPAKFLLKIKEEARGLVRSEIPNLLIASDNDKKMIMMARKYARIAGVDEFIEFSICDYAETDSPEGEGVIIFNPPYGIRIGEDDNLERLYSEIGDFFKQRGAGKTGAIFTGNLDLAKKVGLKTKQKIIMYNGAIESRLLLYELYAGSR